MLKHAFARRIAHLVVSAVIAGVLYVSGMGNVSAHEPRPCATANPNAECDQGQAYKAAKDVSLATAHCVASGHGPAQGYSPAEGWTAIAKPPLHNDGMNGTGQYVTAYVQKYTGGNGYEQSCGSDGFNYGSTCNQRSNDPIASSYSINRTVNSGMTVCQSGCERKLSEADIAHTWTVKVTPTYMPGTWVKGLFKITGNVCTEDGNIPASPQQPQNPEHCETFGGATTCYNPESGKTCITATSTGSKFCYAKGEHGPKADTSRQEGSDNPPPGNQPRGPNNREGENWQQGNTSNVSHTTNNVTTNINVTSYSNGSPAPNKAPVSGDGSNGAGGGQQEGGGSGSGQGGGNGDGDGDGEGNESSGGGQCDQPPTSSGDPILGNILTQTFHTRCNAKKGEITGESTCGEHGGVIGFVCTGDDVGCKQALEAKEANCRDWAKDKDGNGQPDWTEGGDLGAIPGEGDADERPRFGINWGTDMLDTSDIFGGGGCQNFTLEIMGNSVSTSEFPHWCNFLAIARALILIFAAYMSIRILLGGN